LHLAAFLVLTAVETVGLWIVLHPRVVRLEWPAVVALAVALSGVDAGLHETEHNTRHRPHGHCFSQADLPYPPCATPRARFARLLPLPLASAVVRPIRPVVWKYAIPAGVLLPVWLTMHGWRTMPSISQHFT
jgi:hypothetical protein